MAIERNQKFPSEERGAGW